MKLTVFAASGRTGLAVTRQALGRGHTVTALACDPERIGLPGSASLRTVAADVDDPASIAAAIDTDSGVLVALLGDRLADKVAADETVLAAGGTVFHAGVLTDGPASTSRRTVGLTSAPPFDLAATISRETVAAAMLDEAEKPRFPGTVAVRLAG
jgi:putative NADH-flavin reductase